VSSPGQACGGDKHKVSQDVHFTLPAAQAQINLISERIQGVKGIKSCFAGSFRE
jgi:hypothetical protein